VCSETFQQLSFEQQCRLARKIGYAGIEIMPGGVVENPIAIPAGRRMELRRLMEDEDLGFVGLHNLLSAPPGMHATTNDPKLRQRTWEFLRELIDLCADLGPHGVMVFGSAKQRSAEAGSSIHDAVRRFQDGLASLATHAQERSVTILVEPLAPHLSNVVNRLDEAVEIVREIDSPAVQTMFDVHNTAAERLPAAKLIGRYIAFIRHVHLNEMDGRRPGTGLYDFPSLFRALEEHQYGGWLSLEVFDFRPSGDVVAAEALEYLQRALTIRN
jgi:sugar phosphate isomerase/epimerase